MTDAALQIVAPYQSRTADRHGPAPAFRFRPYQVEAIEAVEGGFAEGKHSLLITLPTGAGKTVVFAELIRRARPDRCLVLAHREELLAQARKTIRTVTGITGGIEMAAQRATACDQVVMASVATLARGRRIAGPPFDLVIIDEAHHSNASSYKKVIEQLGPERLLGVTATGYRGDKQKLSDIFEDCVYSLNILDLIRQGYLANIKVRTLPVRVDMSQVRIKQGDFSEADLGSALEPRLAQLADVVAEQYVDRKLLTFCPLRDTSRLWTEALRKRGLPAEHIDGESPDRAQILKRFAAGDTRFLSNASLLLEGYDEPSIDTLLILRPTRSRGLFAQMVGRGTRLFEGKAHLLVLDPLFASERHNILSVADLSAENEAQAKRVSRAMRVHGMDLAEAMAADAEERRRQLAEALEQQSRRTPYEREIAQLALALDCVELQTWEPTFAWHRERPTEKQLSALDSCGVDAGAIRYRGIASEIMDRIVQRRAAGLATLKQVKLMRRMGHPEPERATFTEAREWITAHKHW
jgi:superfamily II DNA or RNA helicase